ncbi:MAG TPA: vWA domain-containing protein [Thermoanaerobaculia bacterium]|jgi:hypothetical protein|nr:vWA domain-containing protein [Thermoanaerobaculia bacterium]
MRAFAFFLMLFAATAAQAGAGLDLVVLVDASTSMGTDRGLAPLLLRMTTDLMARNAAANRVEHRLAAIAFGSTVRIDLPFTPVRRDNMDALARRIEALPVDDLGDTDVLTAFSAADTLFRTLPRDPERRRAIVLLTDGVPYVRGADMHMYRDSLQRFVSAHFATSDVSVDVLLISRGTPDAKLWRDLALHVEPAGATAGEALAAGHAAVTRMLGTRTVESMPSKNADGLDTLVIPPYLDVVVFDVFRGARDAEVLIFPPGTITPVRAGAAGVESFGIGDVLMTLVVPRPPPGEWIIRRSHRNAHVRILSQQFFPRGVLVAPNARDAPRQYDRITLVYRITDGSSQPLRELLGYALSADVLLLRPDGSRAVIAAEPDTPSGGGFHSTGETECDLAGRYWTDVRITTADAHGRRLEVFRDRWSGFSVTPATRIDCRVRASAAACLPVTMRIDCTAPGSRPIDLRRVVAGSPAGLFRAAVARDGLQTDDALELRYSGSGLLRGFLFGASRAGTYGLQVSVDRTRLRAPYNVRILPARLVFVRPKRWPWLFVPLAIGGTAVAFVRIRRRRTTKV